MSYCLYNTKIIWFCTKKIFHIWIIKRIHDRKYVLYFSTGFKAKIYNNKIRWVHNNKTFEIHIQDVHLVISFPIHLHYEFMWSFNISIHICEVIIQTSPFTNIWWSVTFIIPKSNSVIQKCNADYCIWTFECLSFEHMRLATHSYFMSRLCCCCNDACFDIVQS